MESDRDLFGERQKIRKSVAIAIDWLAEKLKYWLLRPT